MSGKLIDNLNKRYAVVHDSGIGAGPRDMHHVVLGVTTHEVVEHPQRVSFAYRVRITPAEKVVEEAENRTEIAAVEFRSDVVAHVFALFAGLSRSVDGVEGVTNR